jgi:hypothetical protein
MKIKFMEKQEDQNIIRTSIFRVDYKNITIQLFVAVRLKVKYTTGATEYILFSLAVYD